MYVKLIYTALTLLVIYVVRKSYSFARNYVAATRSGYPVYVSPVLSKSLLWMILGPIFVPKTRKWLPEWIYERLDISTHGWEMRLKNKMHKKLGRVFLVVSPDENVLWYGQEIAVSIGIFKS
jgi:hypothetical protein